MKTILHLLLWILRFAGPECAHAGHPLWESSLKSVKHAVPLNIEDTFATTWPAGRVRYTYSDFQTEIDLTGHISDAINLWFMAGLPDMFKFVFIEQEECYRNRHDCLVIEKTNEPLELATVVGKYIGPANEVIQGSFALISFVPQRPQLTERINHQIGHILGLYHEHQNPYFWDLAYGGLGLGSIFTLNCESIMGYDVAIWGLNHDEVYGEFGICKNRMAALRHDFLAAVQILPITELGYLPHSDLPTYDDVDWKSIMLYSSTTGARERIRNVQYRALLKQSPPIDSRPPGFSPLIEGNAVPSQADIQAIIQLYAAVDTRFEHRYFHDPHSEFFSRFNEMRNSAACDRDIQQP